MRLVSILALGLVACTGGDAAKPPPAPPALPDPTVSEPPFEAHLAELRRRAPPGFTMVVEPPFVVLGDEPPERVRRRVEVVRWAVRMLKQDFFAADPPGLLEVWLLADRQSYEHHARLLFGEPPSTPYGYYSARHRALVMNIATGGGTLVHEIVHPYMEANAPGAPPWLDEGLGSLYEQSAERDGRIVGLTNWRLAGLQDAIRRDALPSLSALASLNDEEFYGPESGRHYAQARYLLFYLQERDLLRRFFKSYLARREADATGYRALVEVLGEPDMEAFQERWERFVLGLRFP